MARGPASTARRYGGVEYLEDAFGGGLALHSGVAVNAELAQVPVELRREQQHQERLLEGDGAVDQTHPQHHGQKGDGGGGHELQHQPGEKRETQDLHRALAELLARPGQPLCLLRGAPVGFERREPLQGVQEVGSQEGERRPLALHVLLGVASDQDHHHRDHRRRHEQQHGARQVTRQDVRRDEQGNERTQGHLRQIAREVRLQSLDAFGGRRGQLPGAFSRREVRSQPQDV